MNQKKLLDIHTELHDIARKRIDALEKENDEFRKQVQILTDNKDFLKGELGNVEQEVKIIRNTLISLLGMKHT